MHISNFQLRVKKRSSSCKVDSVNSSRTNARVSSFSSSLQASFSLSSLINHPPSCLEDLCSALFASLHFFPRHLMSLSSCLSECEQDALFSTSLTIQKQSKCAQICFSKPELIRWLGPNGPIQEFDKSQRSLLAPDDTFACNHPCSRLGNDPTDLILILFFFFLLEHWSVFLNHLCFSAFSGGRKYA